MVRTISLIFLLICAKVCHIIFLSKVKIAVVQFSTAVYSIIELSSYYYTQDVLLRAINGITYRPGSTNTNEALKYVREEVLKVTHDQMCPCGCLSVVFAFIFVVDFGVHLVTFGKHVFEVKKQHSLIGF